MERNVSFGWYVKSIGPVPWSVVGCGLITLGERTGDGGEVRGPCMGSGGEYSRSVHGGEYGRSVHGKMEGGCLSGSFGHPPWTLGA